MRSITSLTKIFSLAVMLIIPGMSLGQSAEIKDFCKSTKGQSYFLRLDIIRIQHVIGGIDATNILPGPEVSYRAKFGGFRQIQSSTSEDFAEEARLANQNQVSSGGLSSSVRSWKKGTEITIHKVKVKKKEIQWDITEKGGSKSRLRFKFDKHKDAYNIDTVKEMFYFTFAKDKNDVGEKTVEISLGMSIDDTIALKGNPKTRVNLGSKTILTYDDMKLIFLDGKLNDVQ